MKQILDIAEELVSAFNTTMTDYDAIEEAVEILEKHFKDTVTPLRVNPKEETQVSFSHKLTNS